MLTISALLAPYMIFLLWTVVMLCVKDKTATQKKLTSLLIIATVYFFIDANYLLPNATSEDYRNLVFLDILSQFITMALPASIIAYILSFRSGGSKPWATFLMYSPSLFLGSCALIIYSLMGIDDAAGFIEAMDKAGDIPAGYDAPIYRIHSAICQKTYNIVLLTEVLITLGVVLSNLANSSLRKGALTEFFNGKNKLSSFVAECLLLAVMLAICSLRIGLGRQYLISTPEFSGLLSICLAALGCVCAYIGALFPDREFDFWDLRHPVTIRPSESEVAMRVQQTEDIVRDHAPTRARGKAASPAPVKIAAPTLLEQFVKYMNEKKPYLNPELSITDVAYALRSNRTYVSVLINENFGKNFRDYINELRIAHAKQVMLKNPDEILEVIAEKSGFGSDSQFAKKFKEIEDISPKQWLAKQLSQQQ